jgi:hypothetical protein
MHIDAREGLSADMLLAAMVGLLPAAQAGDVVRMMSEASDEHGVGFHCSEMEEEGERGLAISYTAREEPASTLPHADAFAKVASMSRLLGSDGEVARKILSRVFEAESDAHSLPPEEVHLHEIGRPQALLNIAGIGLVAPMVAPPGEEVLCSTITVGRGITATSHGTFRIPAPASAFLLRGLAHTPGDHPGERATPTGLAAVSVIATGHSDEAPASPVKRSVGFGTKRFAGRLGRVAMTIF